MSKRILILSCLLENKCSFNIFTRPMHLNTESCEILMGSRLKNVGSRLTLSDGAL